MIILNLCTIVMKILFNDNNDNIFQHKISYVRADDNTKSVHIDNFTDIDNNTFHYKISC